MPITPRDIREQLLASNSEFQRLAQEHSRYDSQIEQLSKSSFHNAEELIQEAELKKMRLRVKDEMELLVARNSQARAASAD
jgi:uncharacterized protein YdcH (DUF465 family)